MKRNTWLIVMIALTVTGSIVVAKSVITTIGKADAGENHVMRWTNPAPNVAVQTEIGDVVAQPAQAVGDEQSIEQDAGGDTPWRVMVVRGGSMEKIAYRSASIKVKIPGDAR